MPAVLDAALAPIRPTAVKLAFLSPVEDTDVVLWHSFGAHHIVRPEDWPVMSVSHIGFKLKPIGFFDGNPSLNMPRSVSHTCHHGEGG
jgi:primary-amine oxidase